MWTAVAVELVVVLIGLGLASAVARQDIDLRFLLGSLLHRGRARAARRLPELPRLRAWILSLEGLHDVWPDPEHEAILARELHAEARRADLRPIPIGQLNQHIRSRRA